MRLNYVLCWKIPNKTKKFVPTESIKRRTAFVSRQFSSFKFTSARWSIERKKKTTDNSFIRLPLKIFQCSVISNQKQHENISIVFFYGLWKSEASFSFSLSLGTNNAYQQSSPGTEVQQTFFRSPSAFCGIQALHSTGLNCYDEITFRRRRWLSSPLSTSRALISDSLRATFGVFFWQTQSSQELSLEATWMSAVICTFAQQFVQQMKELKAVENNWKLKKCTSWCSPDEKWKLNWKRAVMARGHLLRNEATQKRDIWWESFDFDFEFVIFLISASFLLTQHSSSKQHWPP